MTNNDEYVLVPRAGEPLENLLTRVAEAEAAAFAERERLHPARGYTGREDEPMPVLNGDPVFDEAEQRSAALQRQRIELAERWVRHGG